MRVKGFFLVFSLMMSLSLSAKAENAVYSPSWTAPQCVTGIGPCNVTADLIQSRDTCTNFAEPNQPNTLSTSPCTEQGNCTFHSANSEVIDTVIIRDPNGGAIQIGDTVQVETWFFVQDATRDEIDIFYANNANSPSWTLIRNETGGWGRTGSFKRIYSFKLTGTAGNQAVRVQISRQGTSGACLSNIARSDRDDVVFAVLGNADTDGDGLSNAWEGLYSCMNPTSNDAALDYDNDGLTNLQERNFATNPCDPDTDDGGESDGGETAKGLDPRDAIDDFGENAVYSSTYTCPICDAGVSPCVVPESLIISRDSQTGTVEPHQPNTLNTSACADGTQGDYLDDESTDKFVVTNLSGGQFLPGDTVMVEAWVWCWYPSTINSMYVYQSDGVASPVTWNYKGTASCTTVGFRRLQDRKSVV